MRFKQFVMERMQSLYENDVDFNLTESGWHPLTIRQVVPEEVIESLIDLELGYGYSHGKHDLRQRIADWYPDDVTADHVMVTNGSAEANMVIMLSMLEPGDELVLMGPNYMQIDGLTRGLGIEVKTLLLRPELDWLPDMEEAKKLITDRTAMISVCNPNNPTGQIMPPEIMQGLGALAQKHGAYLHADEIYRGSELSGTDTPSVRELGTHTLATGGLSKTMGLPGLRIGWVVAEPDVIHKCWHHKDYTSITSSTLCQAIATYVLEPTTRKRICDRSRTVLGRNITIFQDWMDRYPGVFSWLPPKAGGMGFVKYDLPMGSSELSDELRINESVFVVAGDCFGFDKYLRFAIGMESDHFAAGLERVSEGLARLFPKRIMAGVS